MFAKIDKSQGTLILERFSENIFPLELSAVLVEIFVGRNFQFREISINKSFARMCPTQFF